MGLHEKNLTQRFVIFNAVHHKIPFETQTKSFDKLFSYHERLGVLPNKTPNNTV